MTTEHCMKFKLPSHLIAIAALTFLLTLSGNMVNATSEIPQKNPGTLLTANHKPIAVGRAYYFASPTAGGTSYVQASNGGSSGPRTQCTGYDDPACSTSANNFLLASAILGVCQSATEATCVESLSSVNSEGVSATMNMIGGGATVFVENASLGLPRATQISRWEATDGTHYILKADVTKSFYKSDAAWKVATTNVSAILVRISTSEVTDFARGTVGDPLKFETGATFSLKIRLPKEIPGWFQGRLVGAKVSATALTSGSTSYSFTGAPTNSPVPTAQLDYTTNPSLFDGMGAPPTSFSVSGIEPGNSLETFKRWSAQIDERAITTLQEWRIATYTATSGLCFNSSSGVTGIVTTNAGSYAQQPPAWNATTKALEFGVGSSHLDENGSVIVGTYGVSLPTAAVKCLYGEGFVPDAAEVSVSYDNGSTPYSVTQKVAVTEGWINVSVSGFHYSAPKISMKLTSSTAANTPSGAATGLRVKRGSPARLNEILPTKPSQKAKWSATGPCKVSSGRLVAIKAAGTCIATVRVLDSKKKYVVLKSLTYTIG